MAQPTTKSAFLGPIQDSQTLLERFAHLPALEPGWG